MIPTSRPADTARPATRVGWWIVVNALVLMVLVRLGHGPLAAPPVLHPARLPVWIEARDGPTVAFAVVRTIAVLAAAYLFVALTVGLAARATRHDGLVAITDRVTLPIVRRLLAVVVGAGLTASLGAASVLPAAGAGRVVVATSASPGPLELSRRPDGAPILLERLPTDPGTATMAVAEDPPAPPTPGRTWTVRPGDSFWSIADATLAARSPAPPSAEEIEAYWARLVAHNDRHLAVPGTPDLIFPGQVFELPA